MQRMDLLLEKTPPEDVKTDVLPMVYRALGSNVSQIQELCLSIIPSFAGKRVFMMFNPNSFVININTILLSLLCCHDSKGSV